MRTVHHPECDLRPRLGELELVANAYTLERIRASYEFVDRLLARCGDVEQRSALDAGCGSGFETFALGLWFDSVVAFDANKEAVAEAEAIRAHAAIPNVRFLATAIERFHTTDRFDFAYCNAVSQAAGPRSYLVNLISSLLRPNGIFVYGEILLGYGAAEMDRAIEAQDRAALALRVRQLLTAIGGDGGFRAFPSGSASELLQAGGFEIIDVESHKWFGEPTFERYVCRARARGALDGRRDELAATEEFRWIRRCARDALNGRRKGGFTAHERDTIARAAEDPAGGHLAAYLLVLLIAEHVPETFAMPSLGERVRNRLRRAVGQGVRAPSRTDWESISRIFQRLKQRLASERAGGDAAEN